MDRPTATRMLGRVADGGSLPAFTLVPLLARACGFPRALDFLNCESLALLFLPVRAARSPERFASGVVQGVLAGSITGGSVRRGVGRRWPR
jgi:hypothetical protein